MIVGIWVCQPALAREKTHDVVRVGFPIQEGISYIDQNGNYAGYMVDYLDYVRLYTDWEIEYVCVDGDLNTQLTTLLQMLESGEIDLLGTMNYSKALEDKFLYPNHPYGVAYTALAVDESNEKLMYNDFTQWETLRVATYPGYQRRMELLEEFSKSYGFQYEILEFETYEQTLEAVKTGVADATIQVDIALDKGLRIISKFSPDPYYFALNSENVTLLQEFNRVFDQVNRTFPFLAEQLHDRYFSIKSTFYVSEKDKEYIKSLGVIKVLFIEGNPPFQYINEGNLKGCAVDYFNQFAEETGLQYEPVVVNNLDRAKELIEDNQVDLVACIPVSSMLAAITEIDFTNPYLSSRMVRIYSDSNPEILQNSTEIFCSHAGLALKKVKDDSTYAPWIDFYSFDYYRQNDEWITGIAVDWKDIISFGYAVAATEDVSDKLKDLLNNYANSLSENDRDELIYRYAGDSHRFTLEQLIYRYRYEISAVAIIILLTGAAILFWKKSRKSQKMVSARTRELNYLSNYDTLTGAYNEKKFNKLLKADCKNKIPHTLVALDIRDFKYINGKFSVDIADRLLKRICKVLREDMLEGEYFCRQSADVFYLALVVDTIENIRSRVERNRKIIQQISSELLDGYPISIYSGFVFTNDSPNPFEPSANMGYMLAALAYAKRKESEDPVFYEKELHKLEKTRHYIESHMKSALKDGEFKLYLQPKKNLATGAFDKAEALVRWQLEDGRMIFPNEFIPVFEATGFCKQLDLYMVELVCKQLRQWIDEGLPPIEISVNQTRLLFEEPNYVNDLCEITKRYGVPNNLITLELLERLSMEECVNQLNQQILQLKRVGFHVSMDDFGSGYSSLNILGDLDIDEVKVDRAFLMGNSKNINRVRKHILVEQIIQLSKKIGVSTVAEGVETMEDETAIMEYGYDYGQGYFYSKPIPTEEFREKYL